MANTLRETLESVVSRHVKTIVDEAIDAYRRHLAAGIGEAPRATRAATPATATTRTKSARKTSAPKRLLTCPVPGCGKPGKGPRFSWFCEDHRNLPAAEKDKILAEAGRGKYRKAGKPGKAAAAKAPTKRRKRRAKTAKSA